MPDEMPNEKPDGTAEGPTVTDLAAMVGMTPRNIRAYQSRGLLFPPEIHGRKARYTGAHVARLKLIASLQREGFTLASIKRLLEHPDSYASVNDERRRRFRAPSWRLRCATPTRAARQTRAVTTDAPTSPT